MAIQVRRGNEADFDASKMLPGEWAVSLDAKYVRMCFAPGLVLRMATYESFEADRAQIQAILAECKNIQTAIERIQGEVNSNAALTVESANSAKESADRAHGEAERAHSEAERAKSYMDGAESVIGVKIADLYQTKAGAIIEKASGESPLCIRDTADNLVRNLKLYGNTEQDGTSGAQLLDARTVAALTVSGITCNVLGDGGIYINGTKPSGNYTPSISTPITKPESGTYVLSHSGSQGRLARIRVRNSEGVVTDYGSNEPFIVDEGTQEVRFLVQVDPNQTVNDTIYPMLNAGTEALPWEPYTGGQPSPNPDYPQEIKSVVVNEVKAHGKNFLKYYQGDTVGMTPRQMLPSGVYYLRRFSDNQEQNSRIRVNINGEWTYLDKIGTYDNGNIIVSEGTMGWYEPKQKIEFLKPYEIETGYNTTKTLMLTTDDYAEEYEPYTENSITLSKPIRLDGIGDVRDRIVEKDGVFGVDRKWLISRVLSSLSWAYSQNTNRFYAIDSRYTKAPNGSEVYNVQYLCTHFGNRDRDDLLISYINEVNRGYAYRYYALNGDIDAWKAFLDENEVYTCGLLDTPTFEPLPTADQIALRSLLSYYGTTHIETDSEVTQTIEAECVLDTKRYIDRKFAELATALV